MSYPQVKVSVEDLKYEARVVVYRHSATPDQIDVQIIDIQLRPPHPLLERGDETSKVVRGGQGEVVFDVSKTYPPKA